MSVPSSIINEKLTFLKVSTNSLNNVSQKLSVMASETIFLEISSSKAILLSGKVFLQNSNIFSVVRNEIFLLAISSIKFIFA